MGRLGLAFRCFFRVLGGKPLPPELTGQEAPRALPAPVTPPRPAPDADQAAVQLLSLLQKEGRLLDFLQEEIESYTDEQVGAAVRNIHKSCREVLREHVGLAPVLPGAEESRVTVDAGFDPSRVRLIGNVTGNPPFAGILRHHGWRATALAIPKTPPGFDPTVIAPAEVELP
jgi:hypothetical protein